MSPSSTIRVIAIDPTSRGFGYVVLENHDLIDWGTVHVRVGDRHHLLASRADRLLSRYRPDVLVFEDTNAAGARRCFRVQRLLSRIALQATRRGIRVRTCSRRSVKRAFSHLEVVTKETMAADIVNRFPVLGPRLPPKRRPWMSEDERTSIFDAAAFALTQIRRGGSTPAIRETGLASLLETTDGTA